MPSLDAYAEKIKGIFDLTADMSYATQFKKNQVPNMNRKGLHNNTPPPKKMLHTNTNTLCKTFLSSA